MKKFFNNEDGMALVVVLMLIFFISIISFMLLSINTNSLKASKSEEANQSVFYVAEAGLNIEKDNIEKVLRKIYKDLTKEIPQNGNVILERYGTFNNYYYSTIKTKFCEEYNQFIDQDICNTNAATDTFHYSIDPLIKNPLNNQPHGTPKSIVDVLGSCRAESVNNTVCTFEISSKGFFETNKHRILNQTLIVNVSGSITDGDDSDDNSQGENPISPISDFAAVTAGNISLSEGAKVIGNVSSVKGEIKVSGGAEITGTTDNSKTKELNLSEYLPTFPDQKYTELSLISPPNNLVVEKDPWNRTNLIDNGSFKSTNYITNGYVYNLTTDTRFNDFIVDQNNSITLNVGNNNVNLYVANLNILQGHITITGSGKLNIYVENSINIKGSFNKNGSINNVNLFYKGTNEIKFSGETQYYGSLYSKSADISLTGGAGFYGNIYSGGKNINISGGVPTNGQYIIAPNAKLSLTGGGNIKGTVIANSINANGGTQITFGESVIPLPTNPVIVAPSDIDSQSNIFIESIMQEK